MHLLLVLLYYHSESSSSVLVRIHLSPTASSLSCFPCICFDDPLFLCDASIEDNSVFNKSWRRLAWCLPRIQAAILWLPSSNACLVPILSVCWMSAIFADLMNVSTWALSDACTLPRMQMKCSGWHQSWQVRNVCALTASRQIGRLGRWDGLSPMCVGIRRAPAEINSSPLLRRLNEDTVIILIRWGLPNHRAERKTRARKTIPSDIRGAAAAKI